ncbi:GtrA family protein [Shimia ponticola]|uniref:GtrA family protein n=1 Tax=Shimia ponticola TaxID=2582893 RepID=UPI0011BFD1F5|nr:GtrA family protein [Shimia ponticola]
MTKSTALGPQFLRFLVVGGIAFVTNIVALTLFNLVMHPITAQFLAFPIVVLVAWWCNRRFTFGSTQPWRRELGKYILANIAGWAVNNGIYVLLVLSSSFIATWPQIAVVIGSLSGVGINFFFARKMVFKP